MSDNDILIAAVQETKLSMNSNLNSRGNYSILRKDKDKYSGGGLAFIVHNSVKYCSFALPISSKND